MINPDPGPAQSNLGDVVTNSPSDTKREDTPPKPKIEAKNENSDSAKKQDETKEVDLKQIKVEEKK